MSLSREDRKKFEKDICKVEPEFHVTSEGKITSIKPSGIESIQNEREDDYGDAKTSHRSIANFWNEYLRRRQGKGSTVNYEIDATDVAVMLSLMKVSRLAYKRKHDSFLDFASYADFALQFEEGN